MQFSLMTLVPAVGLLFGSLAMLEIGWRIGLSRRTKPPEEVSANFAVVEGAIYGLQVRQGME